MDPGADLRATDLGAEVLYLYSAPSSSSSQLRRDLSLSSFRPLPAPPPPVARATAAVRGTSSEELRSNEDGILVEGYFTMVNQAVFLGGWSQLHQRLNGTNMSKLS